MHPNDCCMCLYWFFCFVISLWVHFRSSETNVFTHFYFVSCSSLLFIVPERCFYIERSCSFVSEWKGKYKAGLRTSSSSLLLLIFIITTRKKYTTRTDLKLAAIPYSWYCNSTARGPDETLRRFLRYIHTRSFVRVERQGKNIKRIHESFAGCVCVWVFVSYIVCIRRKICRVRKSGEGRFSLPLLFNGLLRPIKSWCSYDVIRGGIGY